HLTFIYPRWQIDPAEWWQYVFPLAAVAVMGALWAARARLGKGPLVAVLVFAGTLVPALGFFDIYPMRYSFVADHFQYLASIGLIALATGLVATRFQHLWPQKKWIGLATGTAVMLVLGGFSAWQTHVYTDRETLWNDTIRKNPECWMAHYNLGKLYLERGKLDAADQHLEAAVSIKPGFADGHSEWGRVCVEQGRYDDAMQHFADALRIDPRHEGTYLNRGVALAQQGKLAEAVQQFTELLEINPKHARAHYNFGVAQAQLDSLEEAARHLTEAVQIDPSMADAYYELGAVFMRLDKPAEALGAFRQAVTLRPAVAHYRIGLAQALRNTGQFDEAEFQLREAQRLAMLGL